MIDASKLRDRLRGIVGTASAHRDTVSVPPALPAPHALPAPPARLSLIETRLAAADRYGHLQVGAIAERLERSAGLAAMLAEGARPPFLFFDLETTGLSGGAGTYAFLVGCAWFEGDGTFVIRQHLLTTYAGEPDMLRAVAGDFARAGALVSFNGKSFDAPLLEMRYLFHRLAWAGGALPHVDVLHPARRFWGPGRAEGERRFLAADVAAAAPSACSLVALERRILGARRVGDIPGAEIPARYFQFVRSGDGGPLEQVLEHNRLDLLSLAGLAARLLHLVDAGSTAALDAREALALGRIYVQAGLEDRAREAFERATSPRGSRVSLEALRSLAILDRRARRFDRAAAAWRSLLDTPGCPPEMAHEAAEALAIHHEHRVRDLVLAKAFVLRSLESGARPALQEAAGRRLTRIERKIGRRSSLDLQP